MPGGTGSRRPGGGFTFRVANEWTISDEADGQIAEVEAILHERIKPGLAMILEAQRALQVYPRFAKKDAAKLENLHDTVLKDIKLGLHRCRGILSSSLLYPKQIAKVLHALRELRLERTQHQLYVDELANLRKGERHPSQLAKLVISKQPFPKPIKKGTTVTGADGEHEEPTLVRLLKAAKTSCTPQSNVRATILSNDTKKGEETFSGGEKPLDSDHYASFFDLKFAKPTRLNIAHLFFEVNLKFHHSDETATTKTVKSGPSEPFVVITNESQWGDSEGELLRRSVFTDCESVTWEHLANMLQVHFLRSTRQDLAEPVRPLSLNDLNYLARARFNNRKRVHKDDYDEFWKWFGLACRRIRHQIPFHSLWMKGYVFGFISREETEKLLSDQICGVFLVRFSETSAGKVVISYVKHNSSSKENDVAHLLLAYGPREAPKHLQNILSQKQECTHVLQLDVNFLQLGPFTRVPKEHCFKDFRTSSANHVPLASQYEMDQSILP